MRITFLPDCTTAVIDGRVSPRLLDAIDKALTFTEPGAFFTPQYKRGLWDGKRRLFKAKTQTFPAGLAPRVLALLESLDVDVEIDDQRPLPWETPPEPVTRLHGYRQHEGEWIDLEADQIEALRAFLDNPKGCLALPTSAGKTEIAAALFATLADRPCLFIVDRTGLMSQAAERLRGRLREPVGLVGAGHRDLRQRITVATIQSLWHHYESMRHKFFPNVGVVCVDECHSISPKMWFQTLEVIPAPVRLGLSATIKEATRRMIVESYLGPIVHEQEIAELIELGRAATPNLAMLRVGGLFDDAQDATYAYWHGVVTHRQRNDLIADAVSRCMTQKKPVLILCVRIPHGRALQERLQTHLGVQIPFLYGYTPLQVIDQAKVDLETGRIPAIIASTIFDKGQDLPAIRALVIAGAQRSALLSIQRAGRAMRKKWRGENTVDILDFMDLGHRNLRSQAKDRQRTYSRKKLNPRVIGSLDEWFV
jgi:superfamily II DNA or RNA helicase